MGQGWPYRMCTSEQLHCLLGTSASPSVCTHTLALLEVRAHGDIDKTIVSRGPQLPVASDECDNTGVAKLTCLLPCPLSTFTPTLLGVRA
jgi:hypothetical protein